MNKHFEQISKLIGKEVMVGNDLKIYFGENISDDCDLKLLIKKGARLTIKSYSRLYGDEDGIRYVTFTDECGGISFEYQDQFITFDPNDMDEQTLQEGLELLLIEL